MPINYQLLGLLIGKQRPYGADSDTEFNVDLNDKDKYREKIPGGPGNPADRDIIDRFGPLAEFGEGNRYKVKVQNHQVIPMKIPDSIDLQFSDGQPYHITKGLRIPYTYKSETGENVHANIFILFNGSGEV